MTLIKNCDCMNFFFLYYDISAMYVVVNINITHNTTGKDDTFDTTKGATYAVVMKLVQGLENKGHYIYCDNYYSSPTPFTDLRTSGFGACGTVRLNQQGIPR